MTARKERKLDREARLRNEHKAKHARHRKNGLSARHWSKQ